MLSFADATGNLFNRLGRLGKVLVTMRDYQEALQPDLISEDEGIVGQFNAEPDIQAITGSAYIGQLDLPGAVGTLMQGMAIATVNRMVFRDNPQINLTLTQSNTAASINEILRQMKVEGATIRAITITATPQLFTGYVYNVGNGVVVASVRRPVDGAVLENSFAENVKLTCSSDSYSGTATAGNEGFQVTGVGNQPNFFAFDWPLGSNGSVGISAIDGAANQDSGNLLQNGGWEDWTDGAPDNWEIVAGTVGVNILENTGNTFGSGSSLELVGDGTTLITLRQEFNSTTGTDSGLAVVAQAAFNTFIRRDGTIPGQGILAIELVDDGGVIIEDEGGTPNQILIDLTTDLTVFFAGIGGAFRTPEIMPETYYLQIRMTAALSAGRSIYIDCTALGYMTQLYTSGPYFAVFAGSVPFAINDFTTVEITSSYGAAGTLNTWQILMNRLLNLQANDVLLPSSATPTISDDLITR